MTRFGQISPLGQNLKVSCKILKVYIEFDKFSNLPRYFCNFYAIGRFCKWPNIYKTISPSGHTEAPSRLSSASALGSVTILCVVPTNMKEEVTPPFDTLIIVAIDKYGPRRYWAKIEMSNYWLKLKSLVVHRTCDAVTSRHTYHHQIFTL